MTKQILILLFAVATFTASAQQDSMYTPPKKYNKLLSVSYELGYMLGNGTTVGDKIAARSNYQGIEARLGFRLNNPDDSYNQVYRFPIMGLGFYTSTFHEAEIGHPHALFYYFNVPVNFQRNKKLTMSYIGAFGLSYNFNPFDSIHNPSDVFIGSYNNCYFNFAYLFNYHIHPQWVIDLSLGVKHFSNGSFKQPNYGINLFLVGAGVSYRPRTLPTAGFKKNVPKFIRHNQFNVSVALGSKNYVAGEDNYLKSTLSVNWLRALGYKYRAGVGLDMFYAAAAGLRNDEGTTFANSTSYAVVGSWEWALTRKLYVPVGLGFYLKRNSLNGEATAYYERVGMRYRFNNHLFAGITIKAHKGVADYFEWTIGYTLFKDANTYTAAK